MLDNEFHNITLGGTIEVATHSHCHIIPINATLPFDWLSTLLELAQGLGLVTLDPFSSCELVGVWA